MVFIIKKGFLTPSNSVSCFAILAAWLRLFHFSLFLFHHQPTPILCLILSIDFERSDPQKELPPTFLVGFSVLILFNYEEIKHKIISKRNLTYNG